LSNGGNEKKLLVLMMQFAYKTKKAISATIEKAARLRLFGIIFKGEYS
jgi:hypothetical protein